VILFCTLRTIFIIIIILILIIIIIIIKTLGGWALTIYNTPCSWWGVPKTPPCSQPFLPAPIFWPLDLCFWEHLTYCGIEHPPPSEPCLHSLPLIWRRTALGSGTINSTMCRCKLWDPFIGNMGWRLKLKRYSSPEQVISQLRGLSCHMVSHICHPTQVNSPRFNPSQTGWCSIYLSRRDGRLSWPTWLMTVHPPADGHPAERAITAARLLVYAVAFHCNFAVFVITNQC